jgi:hypothetical protein
LGAVREYAVPYVRKRLEEINERLDGESDDSLGRVAARPTLGKPALAVP